MSDAQPPPPTAVSDVHVEVKETPTQGGK